MLEDIMEFDIGYIFFVGLFAAMLLLALTIVGFYLACCVQDYCYKFKPIPYREFPLSLVKQRRFLELKPKNLELDMNRTLMHAIRRSRNNRHVPTVPHDFEFTVGTINQMGTVFQVQERPHVDFFLQKVSQWFDWIIYTAATQSYADKILNNLNPKGKYFCLRFYRKDCINIHEIPSEFLGIINEDLSNIMIIDNSSRNPTNSIIIPDFRGDPNDTELQKLLLLLDCLRFTGDVRNVLQRNNEAVDVVDALVPWNQNK